MGENKKSRFECENGFLKTGSASCNHIGNYYGRPRLKCGLYWKPWATSQNHARKASEKWIVERKKDQFPHGNSFILEDTDKNKIFPRFHGASFCENHSAGNA